MNEKQPVHVPWVIPISLASVAAAAKSQTSPSTSVGPYNFVFTRLAIATANSGGVFTITIKDESLTEQFMVSGVRSDVLVPADSKMVDLPRPWRFNAHSSIYVEATNNGGSTDSLYLALHGYLEK